MTERDVRARRTIDPRRRKQERLTRTIVVAGVLAATVGIAVIGNRATSGHDNDAAALEAADLGGAPWGNIGGMRTPHGLSRRALVLVDPGCGDGI